MGGGGRAFARYPTLRKRREGWGTRICDYADGGEEGEGVAGHDGGRGVGEPEQSDGDGDAGDSDLFAEDGVEEEGDPGGGEEFGVGGALVGGEEHVGIDDVEGCGEEGGVWAGEAAGEVVEGEACGGEGQPGVGDGGPGPRHDETEEGSDDPGDGRVEDEAGFAGVPGWGVGPVGVEGSVGELSGGFEPVEDVEVEVVAAGAAVAEEGDEDDERGEREDQVVEAGLSVGHVFIFPFVRVGFTDAFWARKRLG